MSTKYITISRKTPMLLPPDLREWVASDDMVHFVIEAAEGLPTKHFATNRRGLLARNSRIQAPVKERKMRP